MSARSMWVKTTWTQDANQVHLPGRLGWLPTPNLTILAFYLNTGSDNIYDGLENGENPKSLGDGWVGTLQYKF
jgi:hypothetical protein